jgi:Aldo/keto reductase family
MWLRPGLHLLVVCSLVRGMKPVREPRQTRTSNICLASRLNQQWILQLAEHISEGRKNSSNREQVGSQCCSHTLVVTLLECIIRVEEVAKKKGCSMAQIAVAWALKKTTAPIVGTTSLNNLREMIGMSYSSSIMIYLRSNDEILQMW